MSEILSEHINKTEETMINTTLTNIAFMGKEGCVIPFGAFIEFETSEKSPYGKGHKDIGFVSNFQNGEIGILDFLRAFECHKLRYMKLKDLDLGSVKVIEEIDVNEFIPIIYWIQRYHA